ncbi:MAG: reverse transcriptase family protein [Desulfobacula sp.]|nr:reverse transcriptase family protein [Desulfobacula sp.]
MNRCFSSFMAMREPGDMCALLRLPLFKLKLLSLRSVYNTFEIKKNGGARLIETPAQPLMKYLKSLKNFLQAAYYYLKTDAAYGYILNPGQTKNPRNIMTNAKIHLGNPWMLNIDLDDFFHQVKEKHVQQIFGMLPFRFSGELVQLLCKLSCYKGRLPMGSPTSPPMSNFAMIPVDNRLLKWARSNGIVYTRFVDDLTFSSQKPINSCTLTRIEEILYEYRWKINQDKVVLFGESDIKKVTGLELRNRVSVPDTYFEEVAKDIVRLEKAKELVIRAPFHESTAWIKKLEQHVNGQINFLGMVYGYGSPEYLNKRTKADAVLQRDYEPESLNWLDFPYQFF